MSDSDERLAAALQASEDCAAASDDKPEKKQTDWWGEIKGIFWLVLAVLAFHSFVAKPFYIPSESMMPGLIQGDRLVVTKYPYGWSYVSPSFHVLPFIEGRLFGRMPERGDIVITVPRGGRSDYIKRVIGLPGDTIEVRGGAVFLNGTPLRREQREPAMIPIDANVPCSDFPALATTGSDGRRYCRMPVYREYTPEGRYYDTVDLGPSPADYYGPVTIPEGHLFLMGDNRDQSADSRAPLIGGGLGGPVPVESIGGRAEFITFSLDGTSQWYNPISWFSAMRSGRAGTGLHPGQVGAE
ncbi:signal peptidase I [Parasphingopyxis algicola]|uniref:signal peptidase I n=1 Tax=Parasphingopyxis algicola TaxID=2026624 RepID=UPI0015A35E92|nr:signal peptidase I [Parasphingopyxis algicola]QLC25254.1 signal peptidase I [Parasphingopyxis algicola]